MEGSISKDLKSTQKIMLETFNKISNDAAVFSYLDFITQQKMTTKELEIAKTKVSDWTFEEEREYIINLKENYFENYMF